MKLKKISVVIKADDNKVYQVLLSDIEQSLVQNLIENLHGGKIKVLNQPIDLIDIKSNK